MNGLDFLEKINDMDDSLVDEAAKKWSAPEKAAKPKPWVYITAGIAAAAAVALLIIGLNAGGGRVPSGNGPALVSAGETEASTETKTTKPTETTASVTTAEPDATVTSAESNAATDTTAPEDHGESDNADISPAPAEPEPDTDSDYGDHATAHPDYRVMYIESFAYEDDALSEDEDANPAPEETVAFWEDGTYTYYMSQERLSRTFVTYENGEVEDLVTALENGHIDITDLDTFDVPYGYE